MINQDDVRARLIECLAKKGIKQTFIANYAGIMTPTLSRFKKGTQELWDENLSRLDKFLTEQGY